MFFLLHACPCNVDIQLLDVRADSRPLTDVNERSSPHPKSVWRSMNVFFIVFQPTFTRRLHTTSPAPDRVPRVAATRRSAVKSGKQSSNITGNASVCTVLTFCSNAVTTRMCEDERIARVIFAFYFFYISSTEVTEIIAQLRHYVF